MVRESNQKVFLIQIDASNFAELDISEFEISRFDCIYLNRQMCFTFMSFNLTCQVDLLIDFVITELTHSSTMRWQTIPDRKQVIDFWQISGNGDINLNYVRQKKTNTLDRTSRTEIWIAFYWKKHNIIEFHRTVVLGFFLKKKMYARVCVWVGRCTYKNLHLNVYL